MKRLIIFFLINVFIIKITSGQKEADNWLFGANGGLSFSTGAPVFLPGSAMNAPEGCSSISDKQGNLLMYSDGATVWNRNHQPMPNGTGLGGDPGSTQSVIITTHPSNPSIYYLFTTSREGVGNLSYSIIDLNSSGGLGDVVNKNIDMGLPVCEKIIAVKHRNGSDVWVITHQYGSNYFLVYPITCAGPVTFPGGYAVGSAISTPLNTRGYMKVSPDGKRLVMANAEGNVELFDFNDATGAIGNFRSIPAATSPCQPYGVEFSPDSRLLYVTESCGPGSSYSILQYDLTAANIPSSKLVVNTGLTNPAGALQLGPDDKIYVAFDQSNFLGAITSPNTAGPGCNFQKQFFTLPGSAKSGLGLPSSEAGIRKTLLGDDTTFCDISSKVLRLNLPNSTYEWSTGSHDDSLVVSAPGLYWVEVTQDYNGTTCKFTDSIRVNFAPTPRFSLGNDTTVCANTLNLSLSNPVTGATYLWQDSTTTSTLTVKAPGTYWLQTTLNGCSFRDSVRVTSSPPPSFSLRADTSMCGNQPLTIGVNTPGLTYLWSTGNTTGTISADTTGSYWLQATNNTGCSFRDTVNLTFNPLPNVNLGNDTSVCALPLTLGRNIPNATYLWQDGSSNPTYSASAPGLYWLQATLNGCSARDSINIKADPVTAFELGRDTIICSGQSFNLQVPATYKTYLWNTGSTSNAIPVTTSGTYWLEASNNSGCIYRDTIRVTFNTQLYVQLGNDTTVCKLPITIGHTVPNATYLWQDGSTNSSYTVLQPGLYWLQTSANGCSGRDSIRISLDPALAFNLGRDTVACSATPLNLKVNSAYKTYLWSTGSTASNINVNASGTYWLEASNNAGCTFRDTINIVFNQAPLISLGNDTALCLDKLPLVVGKSLPGVNYLWQDGSTNPTFSIKQAGTYWVEASANGCTVRDSISVNTGPPTAFSLGADTVICSGQPLTLHANVPSSGYLWNTGNNTPDLSVSTSGVYWLDITNASDCTYRDSIRVLFQPAPPFSLGRDTVLCDAGVLMLDVTNAGNTYLWQDQSTQPTFLVNRPGVYHVTVNSNGCVRSDTISVTYKRKPVPDLGADRELCPGEELILNPRVQETTYTWQDGSKAATFRVTAPGRYSVKVDNQCGTGVDEVIVNTGACSLQFPNAFTPGKRPNDLFKLINGSAVKDFRLQVFNRWGQVVYQSSNPAEGWDGKSKGVEQPAGMYIFVASYADNTTGKQFTQKGTVVLIR